MPLTFKPHTARVLPARLVKTDAGEALPLENHPESTPVSCQIRQLSAESAYRRFGVELTEAFLLTCELEDAPRGGALDTPGTLVWWQEDQLWLKVETGVKRHLADPETQHAQALLRRAPLREGRPKP